MAPVGKRNVQTRANGHLDRKKSSVNQSNEEMTNGAKSSQRSGCYSLRSKSRATDSKQLTDSVATDSPSDNGKVCKRQVYQMKSDEENSFWSNRKRYEYLIMKFRELEKQDPEKAKLVLDYYEETTKQQNIHLCGLFLSGKCHYMSYVTSHTIKHMLGHKQAKLKAVKVIDYPGDLGKNFHDYVTQTFADLKEVDSSFAEQVLELFHAPRNKGNKKVHMCSLCLKGECGYFNLQGSRVRCHIKSVHQNENAEVVKIISYPGTPEYTFHEYFLLSFSELKAKNAQLAKKVLSFYRKKCLKRTCNVHLCGLWLTEECELFTYHGQGIRNHILSIHQDKDDVPIYKVINYP